MSDVSDIDYKKLYIREISKRPVLSKDETLKKFEKMANAKTEAERDKIRDEIIECNQRLVLFVVNNYIGLGVDFYDLFSEGCLSLMEAIEKFNYQRGNSFAPFAIQAIKRSIRKCLDKNPKRPGLTMYMNRKLREYENAKDELYKRTGSSSKEEIAKELGITPEAVAKYEIYAQSPVCIDSYIRNDSGHEKKSYKDLIVSEELDNEEELEDALLIQNLDKILLECGANQRDIEVVKTRYGFYNGNNMVRPEDVAKIFKISRQRVNQIELKILKKLKAYVVRTRNIEEYGISGNKPNGISK